MARSSTVYNVNNNISVAIEDKLKLATRVINNTRPMMAEISLLLHSKASLKLQKGSRSGRIYKRGSITHQASAVGENPKSDTGTLLSSLKFKSTISIAFVGTSERYASILEDELNRPWLEQTLDESGGLINRIIAKHIQMAL